MTDAAPAGGDHPPAGVFMRMTRRRFVSVAGGGAAALLAGRAWLVEPRHVEFTHHAVNARTQPGQRAVRFVQLSDLHLRQVGQMHRRIAAEVNRLDADFLLFTGDSVDRADRLPQLAELLALFNPATPKYAILGNWEYWSRVDRDALNEVYRAANCRLLVNRTAVHDAGGRAIAITGLDDLVGGTPDMAVLRDAPPAAAHLLLAHCPQQRDLLLSLLSAPRPLGGSAALDFDLARITMVLSGHTHGGQVRILGWTPMVPGGSGRYLRGWYRESGTVPMYVSRGIGTSVVPLRLGARPEVAVFTLWV